MTLRTARRLIGRLRAQGRPVDRAARFSLGAYEFHKKGVSRFDLGDPYHLAVTLTWPQFFAAIFSLYLAVNTVFALFYFINPGSIANARPYSLVDAFFFSFETLATVGYGFMYPTSLYGHVVASAEIMCGLVFTAILTGLIFVRFSRPRPKFVFAENPVVASHNGKPTLMLRVGNGRLCVLADAAAKLNVLLSEITAEGRQFRRAQELRLERAHIPIFPLSWTLMHVLDEKSALYGYDAARMVAADARLFVTFQARDPTLATVVHDIRNYAPGDIRFGMRYADAVTTAADGTPLIDLDRIGDVEPDSAECEEQGWIARETAEIDEEMQG